MAMATDSESDCELPDPCPVAHECRAISAVDERCSTSINREESNKIYGNKLLPISKRNDFYSDSSDVKTYEPLSIRLGIATAAVNHVIQYQHESAEKAAPKSDIVFSQIPAQETAAEIKMRKNEAKLQKLKEKEEKQLSREKQKAERQLAKQQLEFVKQRKRMMQDAERSTKPGECLKHLTTIIDPTMLTLSHGIAVATCLQSGNVRYEVHSQLIPNLISFYRTVTIVAESQPMQLESVATEVVEKQVVLHLPSSKFIQMIHLSKETNEILYSRSQDDAVSLEQYISNILSTLEHCSLTVVVQGMESYYRQQRNDQKRTASVRDECGGGVAAKRKQTNASCDGYKLSRLDVEEAILAVQLRYHTAIDFVETDVDFAKLVMSYAKSIAETPFKRSRLETKFDLFMDGGRTVKVSKEGNGLLQVWREQLLQFKNVGTEVANAIVAQYPSPRLLIEAYNACLSDKQAELLLQDIEVRRGAGVLSTTRRVGKELSRRIYFLMSSTDGNFIIK